MSWWDTDLAVTAAPISIGISNECCNGYGTSILP